jgi:hypothetical protein
MDNQRAARLQRVVRMGVNWMLGAKGSSTLFAWRPALEELDLEPAEDLCSRMRVRIFAKARFLRTWLGFLRRCPAPAQLAPGVPRKGTSTELQRMQRWIKVQLMRPGAASFPSGEHGQQDVCAGLVSLGILAKARPDRAARERRAMRRNISAILRLVATARADRRWGRLRAESGAGLRYATADMAATRDYLQLSVRFPGKAWAARAMAVVRLGRVLWTRQLAAMGVLRGDPPRGFCPICGEPGVDGLGHLLARCVRLDGLRNKARIHGDLAALKRTWLQATAATEADLGQDEVTRLWEQCSIMLVGGQVHIEGRERPLRYRLWLGRGGGRQSARAQSSGEAREGAQAGGAAPPGADGPAARDGERGSTDGNSSDHTGNGPALPLWAGRGFDAPGEGESGGAAQAASSESSHPADLHGEDAGAGSGSSGPQPALADSPSPGGGVGAQRGEDEAGREAGDVPPVVRISGFVGIALRARLAALRPFLAPRRSLPEPTPD